MKKVIVAVVSIALMCYVFFYLDPLIVQSFLNQLPATPTVVQWVPTIKVVLWILLVFFTGGLTFWLSIFIGGLLYGILYALTASKK